MTSSISARNDDSRFLEIALRAFGRLSSITRMCPLEGDGMFVMVSRASEAGAE